MGHLIGVDVGQGRRQRRLADAARVLRRRRNAQVLLVVDAVHLRARPNKLGKTTR